MLAAALALVVCSFLPLWARADFEAFPGIRGSSETFSAWSSAFGVLLKLGIVCAAGLAALIVARLAGTSPPIGDRSLVYLGLAGAALLLLVLVLLNGAELGDATETQARLAGINITRGVMLFVGTGLAAAMFYGAYLHRSIETPRSA